MTDRNGSSLNSELLILKLLYTDLEATTCSYVYEYKTYGKNL